MNYSNSSLCLFDGYFNFQLPFSPTKVYKQPIITNPLGILQIWYDSLLPNVLLTLNTHDNSPLSLDFKGMIIEFMPRLTNDSKYETLLSKLKTYIGSPRGQVEVIPALFK